MRSLPPTLILLRGLKTANHADYVADLWRTGNCPNLRMIEMRTWSEGEPEASALQKAFSAKLTSESGFPNSPKYVGIVDVVPVLQGQYRSLPYFVSMLIDIHVLADLYPRSPKLL